MSVCMRRAETAFHIREMGSSLGTAPDPRTDLHLWEVTAAPTACACACASLVWGLCLCMPPVVSMLSRGMCL